MTAIHPSRSSDLGPRLYGRRVVLRPQVAGDFESWSEVRVRNEEWLVKWEPQRLAFQLDSALDRNMFVARCTVRERERQAGTQYSFGVFVDGVFCGEVNLNNVVRGALQTATIGYWIDQAFAGNDYIAESVVVAAHYAFEHLRLHRLEVCIIPRNYNSHRVMEKIGIRAEGTALRFLEINGVWEDHVRYGLTAEEWNSRRADLVTTWLGSH